MPVKLPISVEQRDDQIQIADVGPPYENFAGNERVTGLQLRGFLNFAVANAGCAGAYTLARAADNSAHRLQIHIPAPIGNVVGVADLMPELRPFAAYITNSCHWVKTPGNVQIRAKPAPNANLSVT